MGEIKNMQEVSKLINFLSENNMRSESDIENRAAEKYNDRMVIVSKLNRTQNQINDIADVIKLIRTYEKYKPYHKNLMTAKNQKQYKKENITALDKYDDAVAKLLSLYPDRRLPTISTLEEKRKKLTSDVQQMNEEYKAIIDGLKRLNMPVKALTIISETMTGHKIKAWNNYYLYFSSSRSISSINNCIA